MTHAAVSHPLSRLRILALLLGAGLFLWLPFEDPHEQWSILFAAALGAWFAARSLAAFRLNPAVQPGQVLLRAVLTGLLAGLAVAPLAAFLMIFKTGLHGHNIPDFSPEQILSVLRRTPIFAGSGLLLGLGSGLFQLSKSTE